MLETFGLRVNRLIRVSYGPFQLGELADGAVKEVETAALRTELGEKIVTEAGCDFEAPLVDHEAQVRKRPSPSAPLRGAPPSPRKRGEGGERQSREPGEGHARGGKKELKQLAKFQETIPKTSRSFRRAAAEISEAKIMRVVGGRLRSRPIAGPQSDGLRPTADRLREALFNILMHAYGDPVTGARVLDLFAGTGALGIEAISRGAAFALFVDDGVAGARAAARQHRDAGPGRRSPAFSAATPPNWGRSHRSSRSRSPSSIRPTARAWPSRRCASARDGGWLKPEALVVVEEAADAAFKAPEGFTELERRKYDDTELVFLRHY